MKIVILAALFLIGSSVLASDGPELYGTMPDGQKVYQYTLTNGPLKLKCINLGGIVTELHVPNQKGKTADIVLGMADLKGYLDGNPYFGCITGRVANRIAKGQFTLDGQKFKLAANDGPNHLHGGVSGFDKRFWKARPSGSNAIEFTYESPDGEEGYPGNLKIRVVYALPNPFTWHISYYATTDKPTIVNLTQHSYFNLSGHDSGDILGHELNIQADEFTAVDSTLIPTGKLSSVENTPFDFRKRGHKIGERIKSIKSNPVGYDLNYVLRRSGDQSQKVAAVADPKSGRIMELSTTAPGLQLYTGNFLDGKKVGKGGVAYQQYAGLCLETQHFPDAINQPNFASIIVRPDKPYMHSTEYKFTNQDPVLEK